MRTRFAHAACLVMCLSLGCSGSDDPAQGDPSSAGSGGEGAGGTPSQPGECVAYEEWIDGRCVDPIGRYEPAERIDFDNIADNGVSLTELELPEPPKSGFRLVVPPRVLGPSKEDQDCVAWAYPELTHKNVYAARLVTNGMLHHSNMYGMPLLNAEPSPYPGCAAGQGEIFNQVPNWTNGIITDVLFANSTQIEGGETVAFLEGMAFPITTEGREIATSIHWLNPTTEEFTSEIVYDFFTMPSDQMTETLVPFVYHNQNFTVPAQTTADVSMTCDIATPGNIVSLMPHNHERTTRFAVDLIDSAGAETRIMDNVGFDPRSDILVFPTPISMTDFVQIRSACTVENDLEQDIVYGVGVNEMCTLFGYLYPPEAQQLGAVLPGAPDCVTLDIGQYR